MLATALVVWMIQLLSDEGFDLTLEFEKGYQIPTVVIVLLTIIFWILHVIISEDKDFERYTDVWDEPEIQFARICHTTFITAVFTSMLYNYERRGDALKVSTTTLVILVIFDIINAIVIFNSYSFSVRESITDSILMQIRDIRAALALLILIMFIFKFTIVGTLLAVAFFSIILKLFFK